MVQSQLSVFQPISGAVTLRLGDYNHIVSHFQLVSDGFNGPTLTT